MQYILHVGVLLIAVRQQHFLLPYMYTENSAAWTTCKVLVLSGCIQSLEVCILQLSRAVSNSSSIMGTSPSPVQSWEATTPVLCYILCLMTLWM